MKIILADDHRLVRDGLRSVLLGLSKDVELIEAWDATTLQSAMAAHPNCELALVDFVMPGMSGIDSIGALRARFPAIPLVVLSALDGKSQIEAALRSGASGYVTKDSSAQVLLRAVSLVLAGGRYLPETLLFGDGAAHADAPMVDQPPGADAADAKRWPDTGHGRAERPAGYVDDGWRDQLTPKQRAVLDLVAEGKPNKRIASQLGITEGTVKSHVSQILRVIGVRNRTAAVIALRKAGG